MSIHLPDPATLVSYQSTYQIKPELTSVKLPPIRQTTPEHRYSSSKGSPYDFGMPSSRSVSSNASSGFQPSSSASPVFSTCILEPQYGAVVAHTGGKVSKKKREDRKQYSKRAATGTMSSKIQKSDNEAGNRYCQALDQAELAQVCRQANPNIENTAAPRHGSPGAWVTLKNNNIAWDVRQDGIEPSMWNKSSVNGSAILQLRQSNKQFADSDGWMRMLLEQRGRISEDQIWEQIIQYHQCQKAAVSTRGEAHWKTASERMIHDFE